MDEIARAQDAPTERLVTFALGTFHTVISLIVAVLILHLIGALVGLLTGLNTLTGLALFAALWVTTTWSTGRALRGVPLELRASSPVGGPTLRAVRAGALNGILFLASAAIILAVSALLTGQGQTILVFVFGGLVLATVGSVAAATVGAIIGVLLAAIDLVLIWPTYGLLRADSRTTV